MRDDIVRPNMLHAVIVRSAEHGQPFLRAAKRRLAATQLGFSEQQLLPARDALGLETLFAREVLLCDRDQLLALALLGAQLSDVRALEHREHRVATDARAEVGAHRQHARFGTRADVAHAVGIIRDGASDLEAARGDRIHDGDANAA